jgi:hypothetical protein
MKVGFTGTRADTTCEQFSALCRLVAGLPDVTEFHQGCCIGADSESLEVACEYAPKAKRVGHPPDKGALLSRASLDLCHEVRDPKPYLERNRAIVNETDVLVACPKGPEEFRGSGTWATIRYGRKLGRHIYIVWPDGTTTEETPQ